MPSKPLLPLDLPAVELERPERASPRPPLVKEDDWSVVDHVCGKCFARLVGRMRDGARFYRCTGCGASTPAGAPALAKHPGPNGRWTPSICACHLKAGGRDMGIRCVVNDRKGPESPSEIVARQT